jgi:hypothetical protein
VGPGRSRLAVGGCRPRPGPVYVPTCEPSA